MGSHEQTVSLVLKHATVERICSMFAELDSRHDGRELSSRDTMTWVAGKGISIQPPHALPDLCDHQSMTANS